ncbi:MAG: hypothetical protein RSG77_24740, partial [Hafnia sp.]
KRRLSSSLLKTYAGAVAIPSIASADLVIRRSGDDDVPASGLPTPGLPVPGLQNSFSSASRSAYPNVTSLLAP